MGKKLHDMAPLLEFVAGAGLGIFFHWGLHDPEAAYVIFGVGGLISLATYLLKEDLGRQGRQLARQYESAHEITFALSRIADAECLAKAQAVLGAARRDLQLLQNGYIPLDETEFYLAAAKAVDQTGRRVKAVDPVTGGWDTRGALLNYYQSNLRAMERKVVITRVFVLPYDQLREADVQKLLLAQLRDGIDVRVAFREELPSPTDASSWAAECSFDFALYDDRVATEVCRAPGTYHGRKTSQPAELGKYERLYDLIEHNAHVVVEEGGTVVLAAALGASREAVQAPEPAGLAA